MAIASGTIAMENKSGESGQPCLVPSCKLNKAGTVNNSLKTSNIKKGVPILYEASQI